MSNFKLNHFDARFRVCIDMYSDGLLSGYAVSRRLVEPMYFQDISKCILQAEDVIEAQNFPQAFQRIRSFNPFSAYLPFVATSEENAMDESVIEKARGKLITFDVFVLTRISSTWQGHIVWIDDSSEQKYSSILELIRLVDNHIPDNLLLKDTNDNASL